MEILSPKQTAQALADMQVKDETATGFEIPQDPEDIERDINQDNADENDGELEEEVEEVGEDGLTHDEEDFRVKV